MVVSVQLEKIFPRQIPDGWQQQFDVTLLSGSTLADLISDLGVNLPLEALLLVVNDQTAEPDHTLLDGDQVKLIANGLQERGQN
jgi:sulfur carrier protein ThiS